MSIRLRRVFEAYEFPLLLLTLATLKATEECENFQLKTDNVL